MLFMIWHVPIFRGFDRIVILYRQDDIILLDSLPIVYKNMWPAYLVIAIIGCLVCLFVYDWLKVIKDNIYRKSID